MNKEHWKEMMEKAAENAASAMNSALDTDEYMAPTTEEEAKKLLACALRHRHCLKCAEMSEIIYEISEFAAAHMMCAVIAMG